MTNIIQKLYYGEIIPCVKPAPNTKRFAENRELICSTKEQLLEQFPDCKELLDTNADTEIPMLSTLSRSLNVKRILLAASGLELY